MAEVALKEILDWTGGILLDSGAGFKPEKKFIDIGTDSRGIGQGELFVALRGARFDGHDFLEQAIAAGAAGLLVDSDYCCKLPAAPDVAVIRTTNTLEAYQKIAAGYRDRLKARVVAITGSVGKTMTRRMISTCLEARLSVHQTRANLNNEIGLPQTILAARPDHDVMVLELGMRGPGEISLLSRICRPDIAVITNIGWAHIGRLGSRENILGAKTEIVHGMAADGLLIINADDPLLLGWSKNAGSAWRTALVHKRETAAELSPHEFSFRSVNPVRSAAGISFTACLETDEELVGKTPVQLSVPGEHNIYNALFGLAAAYALQVDPGAAAARLAGFSSAGNRQQIIRQGEYVIMDDTYNAGPESMQSALLTLRDIAAGRHRLIAVLGGMLELGEYALEAHRELGEMAARYGFCQLYLVGEYAHEVALGARQHSRKIRISCHEGKDELVDELLAQLEPGDHVLIKGSRAYNLEQVTDLLLANLRAAESGKGN